MARFADTHVHTTASSCGSIEPRELLARAADTGLDTIVITDHNTTRGALAVLEQQATEPRFLDIEVVVGIELLTEFGEIAAIYLDGDDASTFEALRTDDGPYCFADVVTETARRRKKGKQILLGLVHPFSSGLRDAFRFGDYLRATAPRFATPEGSGRYVDVDWWLDTVGVPPGERNEFDNSAVAAIYDLMRCIDFVEVFNGANFRPAENRKAAALARIFKKPGTCGSDAHFVSAVGSCRTEYFGATLREAILAHETTPHVGRFTYPKAALYRTASGFKKHVWRRLPIVGKD